MIISASYRTDIPAFYKKWFKNRLEAGYCMVANPYSNKPYRVPLTKSKVQAFVFWTKNIGPFFDNLDILKQKNIPFMVQYSINNYPKWLENRVIPLQRSVNHVKRLVDLYGERLVVWRYDPIVLTSKTPINWHIDNFLLIAKELHGLVDEVVMSFMQFYKKTVRNISQDVGLKEIEFIDPDLKFKQDMIKVLSNVANDFGMNISLCTQPNLVSSTAKPAACIDLNRLSDIAGYNIKSKLKGNRSGCYCAESRDIGAYDSCLHGCVYCYAVNSTKFATSKVRKHDPNSEFLVPFGEQSSNGMDPTPLIRPQNGPK